MSKELQIRILEALRDQQRSGSADFLEAERLAKNLDQSSEVIREQLDILEQDGCVHVVKTFGPHYSAQILPKGLKCLADVEGEPRRRPRGPIGFKSPKND
jgi:DNA-binding Lrp family transcriptional regulator